MLPTDFCDTHCSLGDGRSFTDPVMNWVLISGLKIDRHLANLLQAGKYPTRYLPDFLHELMHHWCFHSPVGMALALLQMRASRNAMLLLDEATDPEATRIAEDLVRYETAISLMRPLAEGLALFAEFDAAPGDSSVLSITSTLFAASFSDRSEADNLSPAESWENLGRLLAEHRTTNEFRERKANLLVQSFTARNGGYLPGYLLVKNIHRILINQTKSNKLFDRDLYLTYLRSFFYEDYAFVATLLDPDAVLDPWTHYNDSAQNISVYLQKRFAQLFVLTTRTEVDRFELAVSAGQEFAWQIPPDVDPGLQELGRQRLQQMLAEIDFEGPADSTEKILRRNDHWLLAQRDLMCIGSFPAPVEVNVHQRALVGEYKSDSTTDLRIPLCSLPALEGVAVGKGAGSTEFFLSATGRYSLQTVTLNNQVVAIHSLSDNFTDAVRKQVTGYWTSLENATELRKSRYAAIHRALKESTAEVYVEHYRENAARVADELYGSKALLFTPSSHIDLCLQTLLGSGLYEILNKDSDLVRAVAYLSLVVAANPDRRAISEFLAEESLDLDELLDRISHSWESYGLPLVMEFGENLLWSYV